MGLIKWPKLYLGCLSFFYIFSLLSIQIIHVRFFSLSRHLTMVFCSLSSHFQISDLRFCSSRHFKCVFRSLWRWFLLLYSYTSNAFLLFSRHFYAYFRYFFYISSLFYMSSSSSLQTLQMRSNRQNLDLGCLSFFFFLLYFFILLPRHFTCEHCGKGFKRKYCLVKV